MGTNTGPVMVSYDINPRAGAPEGFARPIDCIIVHSCNPCSLPASLLLHLIFVCLRLPHQYSFPRRIIQSHQERPAALLIGPGCQLENSVILGD